MISTDRQVLDLGMTRMSTTGETRKQLGDQIFKVVSKGRLWLSCAQGVEHLEEAGTAVQD